MTGMPSVDTKSIGAGGGSIAWVDQGGLLHVGPISAGAVPGPVAYGRGGTRPTVTDASVMLGYIDPDHFLGGRMRLDLGAAREAIRREVADPLGIGIEEAAAAILELATEHMVQAILDITVNQGIDPSDAAFVAGGGAAGLNCVAIGRRLGCAEVLVPETGAALAAAGALISDLAAHHQAMFYSRSATAFDADGVNAVLGEARGALPSPSRRRTGPDAVLVGIDWTLGGPLSRPGLGDRGAARAGAASSRPTTSPLSSPTSTATHEEIFAVSDPGAEVEMIGWNATIRCRIGSRRAGPAPGRRHRRAAPARRVYFAATGWVEAKVHRFETLGAEDGDRRPGDRRIGLHLRRRRSRRPRPPAMPAAR